MKYVRCITAFVYPGHIPDDFGIVGSIYTVHPHNKDHGYPHYLLLRELRGYMNKDRFEPVEIAQ